MTTTTITMVVTVLVGIGFALFLIFRSLREHVETADRVISELQRGNLKARFPIKKNDEIGRAMERFNQMADQIEQLVERLRSAEASRNFLLQELTHDLRTPVGCIHTSSSVLKVLPPDDAPAIGAMIQTIEDSSSELSRIIDRVSFVLKASADPSSPMAGLI